MGSDVSTVLRADWRGFKRRASTKTTWEDRGEKKDMAVVGEQNRGERGRHGVMLLVLFLLWMFLVIFTKLYPFAQENVFEPLRVPSRNWNSKMYLHSSPGIWGTWFQGSTLGKPSRPTPSKRRALTSIASCCKWGCAKKEPSNSPYWQGKNEPKFQIFLIPRQNPQVIYLEVSKWGSYAKTISNRKTPTLFYGVRLPAFLSTTPSIPFLLGRPTSSCPPDLKTCRCGVAITEVRFWYSNILEAWRGWKAGEMSCAKQAATFFSIEEHNLSKVAFGNS